MRVALSISCPALLALALAACGDSTVSATTTVFSETVEDDGLATIHTDGLVIVIEPPVLYRSSLTMTGGETERSASINGVPYDVREGVLWIGETSYGSVADGDEVRVTAEGVFVDGERRGDTP